MRMNWRKVVSIVILSCMLAQATFLSTATLPYGEFSYASFLSIGKELEWQVSVREWSGNESIYVDTCINDTTLLQGDTIKLTVTRDPNTLPVELQKEGEWLRLIQVRFTLMNSSLKL